MKESEIRPKDLFNAYLELSKKDAESFNKSEFELTNCIACNSRNILDNLIKSGFNYQLCGDCNSLFCNPRPPQKMLNTFYRSSASSKFWFSQFLPAVTEARRERIFARKAVELFQYIDKKNIKVRSLCDVGAGSGIFLEELQKIKGGIDFFAIEPGEVSSNLIADKGFKVLQTSVEDAVEWKGKFDFVVSLEVFEHVNNPKNFVSAIRDLLSTGGHCLVTTLGYEGFDIQLLGARSNSISPPHHLNFLSLTGFRILFEKSGFSKVEVLTPGMLDVDIVLNSESPPAFLKVLESRGDQAIHDLQNFLVKHKLSSHVWIIAQI